jgi:peroxiredoxin
MALTYSEPVRLGMPAPYFELLGTDGTHHRLTDFRCSRVLVVAFVCNHCPYVKAVQSRINSLAKQFQEKAVQVIGISSNDVQSYPEDSFEKMQAYAKEWGWVFPYLWDETQSVAKAYGAVCTPDFFVFENIRSEAFREADVTSADELYREGFLLRYRGRLDDGPPPQKGTDGVYRPAENPVIREHDLADAISAILKKRPVRSEQRPAMGCSIKWLKA